MCEYCVFPTVFALCVLCAFTGPVLLITGGVLYATAKCEVLETVAVSSIVPATQGIGLCDASFIYSSGQGVLTTPCPANMRIDGTSVAVCYPVLHPDLYEVALLASSLQLTAHSVPLSLIISGSVVTFFPIVVLLIGILGDYIEKKYRPTQDLL